MRRPTRRFVWPTIAAAALLVAFTSDSLNIVDWIGSRLSAPYSENSRTTQPSSASAQSEQARVDTSPLRGDQQRLSNTVVGEFQSTNPARQQVTPPQRTGVAALFPAPPSESPPSAIETARPLRYATTHDVHGGHVETMEDGKTRFVADASPRYQPSADHGVGSEAEDYRGDGYYDNGGNFSDWPSAAAYCTCNQTHH